FKLAAPFVHDRHRGNGRRVAQWAKCPSEHVLRQVPDVVDVFPQPATVMEAGERFLEPVGAFAAGNTPATTFVLVELHHAQGELHHAGLVVENHHAAGAKEFAALGKRVEVHVDALGFFCVQQERGGSAGDNGLQLASVGNATADIVDHLLQRVAQGQLID